MRRQSFELTESLLPDNPLEGLEPEPDVLANITARARARRRGEIEATPVTQNSAPNAAQISNAASAEESAKPPATEPHIVYFSATLEDAPVHFVNAAGEPLPPGRQAELAREHGLVPYAEGNGLGEPNDTEDNTAIAPPMSPDTSDSAPSTPRRARKQPAAPLSDIPQTQDGNAESTQTQAINRESSRVDIGNISTSPDIDLDDPHLMSGTHATTLRIDWEVIQGLKRIARDLSRPRKECTMGMLILHALKQTYPDLFEKP